MAPQAPDKFRVLLVDDDPDTRAMYAIALCGSQFEVLEAGDGHTALTTASAFMPDVLITDLSGPMLHGFELLEWLKANPETATIRTIVLTGWSDVAVRARAEALDAQFVVKPCLPETLVFQVFCALAKV